MTRPHLIWKTTLGRPRWFATSDRIRGHLTRICQFEWTRGEGRVHLYLQTFVAVSDSLACGTYLPGR
jgi:hypothetical protein